MRTPRHRNCCSCMRSLRNCTLTPWHACQPLSGCLSPLTADIKMLWVTVPASAASHESHNFDDMQQGNLSQTYRLFVMLTTAVNCRRIYSDLFLSKLNSQNVSTETVNLCKFVRAGEDEVQMGIKNEIMGYFRQVRRHIWFTPYILIWRSMFLSQRLPINLSWTEELFSRAQRHDNSGVTAQPVSKYSICHSGPKAQFSWLSSPRLALSVYLLPLAFTLTWLRVVLVLFLWLHKHVQIQRMSSALQIFLIVLSHIPCVCSC